MPCIMRNRDEISRMLGTNACQKSFYEAKNPYLESGGKASYLWGRARFALQRVRSEARIDEDVISLHREWLGDLSGKKVLDLGCFSGNDLSLELARDSGSYLGIDLSERAIESLNRDLREAGLYGPDSRAQATDFLSPDFAETGFDVVYAKSVLHHFEHLEAMLEVLSAKLAPGGVVVSWDPMQTSPPVWAARMLYRPLQDDRAWEFPFTRRTFEEIREHFEIEALRGIMGRSKWALLIPGAGRLARRWHERDMARVREPGRDLWRCMQVTMKLRRP